MAKKFPSAAAPAAPTASRWVTIQRHDNASKSIRSRTYALALKSGCLVRTMDNQATSMCFVPGAKLVMHDGEARIE